MNMKKLLIILIVPVIYFSANAQTLQEIESKKVQLPNGWGLSPVGKSLPLGDLPLNIAVSPSKKLIAVTNNGQSVQSLQLIDTKKEKVLDIIVIPKSWYGLKFSSDGKTLYTSAGNDNQVLKYEVKKNKLVLTDSILLGKRWPEKISPTGIEIDDARNLLYVVTKENNSLYY
jgi:DNA-binding beta-propeller fold protein YncE